MTISGLHQKIGNIAGPSPVDQAKRIKADLRMPGGQTINGGFLSHGSPKYL